MDAPPAPPEVSSVDVLLAPLSRHMPCRVNTDRSGGRGTGRGEEEQGAEEENRAKLGRPGEAIGRTTVRGQARGQAASGFGGDRGGDRGRVRGSFGGGGLCGLRAHSSS